MGYSNPLDGGFTTNDDQAKVNNHIHTKCDELEYQYKGLGEND